MKFKDILNESSGMILVADKLKKIITDPDYISFTDNGAADLEKKGLTGYYVWVGYVHAGRTGRSDPKRMRAIENRLKDIAKVLADIAKGNVNDVIIEDYTSAYDMYRLYIVNTKTSKVNKGYDLKDIKEQITSLFKGDLYSPPKVKIEDGTPVCTLITISKSHVAVHVEVALSDDEDELVIQTVTDWDSMDTISKLLDDQKSFIEDVIAPKEQALINILKSK